MMRFGGITKEAVIAGGDFLNYDITWDDAERVFAELSHDGSVSSDVSGLFLLHESLIQGLNTLVAEDEQVPS
jgi:hypothetical protein